MSRKTPLMEQYHRIKSEHQDAILFFRMGDFYEMFFEDAETASRELDLALTSRDKNKEGAIPLCGVPFHSAAPYISKLISRGYKVAVCEQVEDPKDAKGIVKREVTRIITPGVILDGEDLTRGRSNYLMAIATNGGDRFGIAFSDISTGDFRVTEVPNRESLMDEVGRVEPRQVLMSEETEKTLPDLIEALEMRNACVLDFLEGRFFQSDYGAGMLREQFEDVESEDWIEEMREGVCAAGAVVHYLRHTQRGAIRHINRISPYKITDYIVLDESTKRNLELTATIGGEGKKGTLVGVLDHTMTPMGSRNLINWIKFPLLNVDKINIRLNNIDEFKKNISLRKDLRTQLKSIQDVERLNARIAMLRASPRDLVALANSLGTLPAIKQKLENSDSREIVDLAEGLDLLEEVAGAIAQAIVDDPPIQTTAGGIIRDGVNTELDELRTVSREGRGWIARMEEEEKKATGINSLKIRYNKVFGYYIEVTRANLHLVPEGYIRKQTLVNSERYISPELKEVESKVLGAHDRQVVLEQKLFSDLRDATARHHERIQAVALALAELDTLAALAEAAELNGYVRPKVDRTGRISIKEGRHPVIERMALDERFVPNDLDMDDDANRLFIITGPNMAGKSTYIRQTALIVLMAQIGCFVPAAAAEIGVVDRVFTRIGALDNISRGYSTFMVEMEETAHILKDATRRSLIILDEIGRGTSTFDGVSIAWAVAEHIARKIGAKTLFATHYHELTDLAVTVPGVKNYNVAVREWNDRIIFLRRIVEGGTSHSYGIQVARLAGLPVDVIERSREILANLESGEFDGEGMPKLATSKSGAAPPARDGQLHLFTPREEKVAAEVRKLEPDRLTPIEALNELARLRKMADES